MIDQLPQKFLTTPIPKNETERLAALHRYKILDTPSEAAFDRITNLAARLFNMPIALISLVDESRAWFKSCTGFDAREVPRDATLCSFAVLTNEPLIIPDTRLDERFACNPFVQSEPGVRFYAGAPLLSRDGFNLGTLCLLDTQPRNSFSAEQQATLVDLATMVVDELELRLAAHKIAQVDAALLEVTQGVATVTGEAYFDALVQHFAKVLDADYVYIGLIEGNDFTKTLRTIATYAHGQIVENLEYPLQETPCWEVLQQRKICCYPRHVQAQFPNAPLLKPLAVESYVAIPFSDSSGGILGLLGVMDGKPLENVQLAESLLTIFAQRIATELERQLFEQERERFLAVGSDLQVIARANGYFQWVSPSFERLLGWTVEEMTSRPWTDFVHPDDVSPSVSEADDLFCGGKTLAFENRYRHQDGSYRWLLWKAQPYSEEQLLYGAAVDISERKQAEQALRLSEARFRTLISASSNVLYRMNADWSEMQELQGGNFIADTSEPIHDWLQKYIYPGDQERVLETIAAAIQNKRLFELEHRVRQADGTLGWTYSRAVPLLNGAGEIIEWFGEASDISDRKRIEAEREQILQREQTAREAAERANKIKDEFLAVLSHELRSPLNPILGWTRLLQNGKLDPTRQIEALKTIERNAKLQSQLIEDLLDISRIMQGKLSLTVAPVSLTKIISAALETVRLAAEAKNITLAPDFDPKIAPVSGDATRLQQVLWNLLTNAIKFTPNGGQVTIELRQLTHQAQIRVIDTGKGINPQFLPHVFEYFRQEDGSTTRKFGGLGLGLAIVRQIVEMHGGTVKAESRGENQGTTFIVQLPTALQLAPSVPEPTRIQTDLKAPLNNIQILLVDDEPDTREFQTFLLEQSGAKVTAVASGLEALQVLDRSAADVLVSDLGMPDMDGYMLIQQIRSRSPSHGGAIMAIALTAYAAEVDRLRAIEAGFQAFVTKPVETENLVKAIISLFNNN